MIIYTLLVFFNPNDMGLAWLANHLSLSEGVALCVLLLLIGTLRFVSLVGLGNILRNPQSSIESDQNQGLLYVPLDTLNEEVGV